MTRKFSQARKDAFVAAVRETGNQTIAAERAKVSRSWVQLHRTDDPVFRRAVDEAVADAKASFDKLRMSGACSNKPATGWGFLDGAELVVRGTGGDGGGRPVQIARARVRQWTPRVEERFLAALAATCNVKAACAEVRLTAASAYAHRKRWHKFAERWDAAVEEGYARIESGLLEHACNLFSGEGGPGALMVTPPMTVAEAIHLLHMHKHRVHALGNAPGKRWRRPRSMNDPGVREGFLRKLDMIERARLAELSDADRARDEAEWARRRDAAAVRRSRRSHSSERDPRRARASEPRPSGVGTGLVPT